MRLFVLRLLFSVLLLMHLPVQADSTVLEVIPLRYRTVDQVLPAVQSFLDRQGAINGMNNQLIIRTTPSNLVQIKEILRQIDTAPRRLLITVKQNVRRDASSDTAELSGHANLGNNARVVVSGSGNSRGGGVELGSGDSSVRGIVSNSQSAENDAGMQQLQVMEGGQAFIRSGKSVPLMERTVVRNGQLVTVVEGSAYHDVTSGFYVRPRLNGDRVTVEIVPRNNSMDERGRISIQQMNTEVSGRLGEWIELGGISQSHSGSRSGVVYSSADAGTDQRQILMKVDEIR